MSRPPQTFESFIDKTDSEGCWIWKGGTDPFGYGRFRRPHLPAHRVSYERAYGTIPEELWVLHKCDVPACVNPIHLFLGTHDDNMDDGVQKRRFPEGIDHHSTSLSKDSVREISNIREKISQRTLAKKYGVSQKTISNIQLRRTWKYLCD